MPIANIRDMRFYKLIGLLCFMLSLSPIKLDAKEKEVLFGDINPPASIVKCIDHVTPNVSEIHRMALRYARLSPEDITRWKKNVKWSAALPRLQFGYARRVVDGVTVAVDDSVSVTNSGVVIGPTVSDWDRNIDRNNNIEVTAVWYLDELIFNRDDLSISSEARAQISARRDMLDGINEYYFDLKRLIAIYLMKAPAGRAGTVHLEINRLIGKLDALTGGWFGDGFRWEEYVCK